jgi:hypothetical protein
MFDYLPDNERLVQHTQMTLTVTQLAIVLSTLTVFVVYWTNGQRQRRNLPPGPRKYPLIGSLLSMPSTLEWETFAKWGQEYSPLIDRNSDHPLCIHLKLCADSDIIHVNVLGTSMIILNSYKVATDLFDRKSSIYSSR